MADNKHLARFAKINDNLTITLCENGYVAEISGNDSNDDWISSKIVFNELKDLTVFIKELDGIEKR
jgi:hypothetical protein